MEWLIRLLRDNPILAFFAVAWGVGAIGTAMQRAKKGRDERKKRTELPKLEDYQQPREESPAGAEPPLGGPRRPSAEEVAAEMRRILGMEPKQATKIDHAEAKQEVREREAARREAEREARESELREREAVRARQVEREALRQRNLEAVQREREATMGDREAARRERESTRRGEVPGQRRPATLGRQTQFGRLGTHVDPHVGERIQRRGAPATGAVGREALGTLGGRTHAGARRRRAFHGLVDLHDLKRAFVLMEVLGKPIALREPRQEP